MLNLEKPGKHNTEKMVKRLCELSDEKVVQGMLLPGQDKAIAIMSTQQLWLPMYYMEIEKEGRTGRSKGGKERGESSKEKCKAFKRGKEYEKMDGWTQ